MSIEMRVEGEDMETISNKLQQLDDSLKSQVQKNLTNLAHSIENTAKQLAPAKTGHLRSTIYAQINDWMVKVGATASYAGFLEFGTRRIRPRRFLSAAVETHVPNFSKTVDDAIDVAVAEAAGK